jgi:EAL domain-containing protein (putative c-di-GMP-specific phosphodiesterase class I)
VLTQVAKRLEAIVRPADLLARIGGDEFTLLLESIPEPGDAAKVAERIIDHLALPLTLTELETGGKGPELHMTASVGIAWGEGHYAHPDQLLRDADIAMYRAKSKGWGGFEVFDPAMHQRAMERLWTESALRQSARTLGTENPRFCLEYQPIISLSSDRIVGFEALLRWRHPERGMVPPAEFIPAAEQTGLIIPIGAWVLKKACSDMRESLRQRDERTGQLTMSVNLSGKQLQQPDLLARVKDALESAELPPWRLKLEITETLALQNLQSIVATLKDLRALGVGLSIDDFGTGYSSLSRLHRLPFDSLKIDGSFIGRLSFDEESTAIIATINQLGHNLGLTVVAEGVETTEQREILRKLGCESYQGYLFSRPLASEQALQLLTDGSAAAQARAARVG